MSISVKPDGRGRFLLQIGALRKLHLTLWEVDQLRSQCEDCVVAEAARTNPGRRKALGAMGHKTVLSLGKGIAALFPVKAPKKKRRK